jgi:competence protein ComEA
MALNSASQSKININQATIEELITLTGIGPELAQRIIDYRVASGGFKTSEELKKVKGIGPGKFELSKDRISIE